MYKARFSIGSSSCTSLDRVDNATNAMKLVASVETQMVPGSTPGRGFIPCQMSDMI